MKNLRPVLVFCLLLIQTGCVFRQNDNNKNDASQSVFKHKIEHPGETLGLIAKWYTNKSSNWVLIAEANPDIRPNHLQLGQIIAVPRSIMVRSTAISQEFINAFLSSKEAEQFNESVSIAETPDNRNSAEVSAELQLADQPPNTPQAEMLTRQLVQSVLQGQLEQTNRLLEMGATPNSLENDRPLLTWAAQNGDQKIVEALLQAGAAVDALDAIGQTALMRAAHARKLSVVTTLLAANADVQLAAPNGQTALSMAISSDSLKIVRALLNAQANPNTTTEDGKPIIFTAVNKPTILKALLKAGADPNRPDNQGQTALMTAVKNNAPEQSIELLLKHGADIDARDSTGQTVLDLAQNYMRRDLIDLFATFKKS